MVLQTLFGSSPLSAEKSTSIVKKTSDQQHETHQDCSLKADAIDENKPKRVISSFLWKKHAHQRFGFQLCQGSEAHGIYISNISANSQLRNSDLKVSFRSAFFC